MATLQQLSRNEGVTRAQEALGLLLQNSPVIRFYEEQSGFQEEATSFEQMPVEGASVVQTRVLGGNYTSSNMGEPTRLPSALGFHGDSLDIDKSLMADSERGLRGVDAYIRKFFPLAVKYWANGFEKLIFQGTGVKDANGREMKGLQNILDGVNDLPGFDGHTGVVDAVQFLSTNPDSFDMTDPSNWDAFMEGMEQLMYMVGATGIMLNRQLGGKMTTIARKNHIKGERRDVFGQPIPQYDSTDLVRVNDGTITNTEPDNAGTANQNTTSLYLARPAENALSIATNSGLEFDDYDQSALEEKRSTRVQWELRAENAIEDKWAILRVRNFKVPKGTEELFSMN